jgi:hypothetical protein
MSYYKGAIDMKLLETIQHDLVEKCENNEEMKQMIEEYFKSIRLEKTHYGGDILMSVQLPTGKTIDLFALCKSYSDGATILHFNYDTLKVE